MNDTQIRKKIAQCDQWINDFETNPQNFHGYTLDDYDGDIDTRILMKQRQLAMWVETYGAAE